MEPILATHNIYNVSDFERHIIPILSEEDCFMVWIDPDIKHYVIAELWKRCYAWVRSEFPHGLKVESYVFQKGGTPTFHAIKYPTFCTNVIPMLEVIGYPSEIRVCKWIRAGDEIKIQEELLRLGYVCDEEFVCGGSISFCGKFATFTKHDV